ncbi:MAG: hypothetical protein ABI823_10310, partial [Bryobacteraceae bacterium]
MDHDEAKPDGFAATEPEQAEAPGAFERPAKPTVLERLRRAWRAVSDWFRAFWLDVRPSDAAGYGARRGFLAAAVVAAYVGGRFLESGFGGWIDYAFAFLVAALVIGICLLVVLLLVPIARKLPRLTTAIAVG